GTTPVNVVVGLSLRHQRTLDTFIADSTDPSSPEFGEAYTPTGFAATYGPASTSVDAVESYLTSEGFTSVSASSNGLLVTASGTATDAEHAFDTTLTAYRLGGAQVYANSTAAMVPSSLSGTVAGVLGLNDVFTASATPVKAGAAATSTLPNVVDEYNPSGFQKAYGDTGTETGGRTTIATISSGAMTSVITNLRDEEAANGLPKVPVTVEYEGLHSPATPTANVEWDLDSQFATGIAQDVSHFYFYDSTTLTDSDLALTFDKWASQDVAKAASASLGECEVEPYLDGSMVIDDEIFAEAAAQGQTMFASSGDTGGACALEGTNGVPDSGPPMVNYFASSPYVVAVGGTTLVTEATGAYDFETSWDAGGGGISQFEYRPSWQAQVMPITAGRTNDRGVPDIAMDANPTSGANVYTTTGVEGVGGTSLSAPLALGTWARIESTYKNRVGFAAPVLYGVYLAGSCTATLSTVEQVCTTPALHAPITGFNGLYPVTPGYNYDTGIGSFDTSAMVAAVKPFVPAAQRRPSWGR
ncbi:MAG: S53 family peptidase, partial [Acidimicrobiales bacterium]